ncbi:MAG: hypothetical protein ACR2MP_17150 [Streptosporangiaceae bacterium]
MRTKETRNSNEHPAAQTTRRSRSLRGHGRAVLATVAMVAGAGASLLMSGGSAGAATTSGIPAGFPSSSNTGVPAGTPMKSVPSQVSSGPGWSWNSSGGYLEVSGNGANLTGLKVNGNIDVSANNVMINDVKINCGGDGSMGISLRHTSNVTIENSNINGLNTTSNRLMVGIKDIYGDATGTVVENDNITKTSTDVQIYAGTIENNYMHQHGMVTGDHINGVTTNGDDQPLLIQHNTILNNFGQTDTVGLFQDFSDVSNVTINDNFLAGGGYTIYGGTGADGPTSNIVVTNNTISTMYFPHGGYYGAATAFNPAGTGNVWSGNTLSTGQAVPAP